MIAFIVGLLLGLILMGLRVRSLGKTIVTLSLQLQTSSTALNKSAELHKVCATTIENMQTVIDNQNQPPPSKVGSDYLN